MCSRSETIQTSTNHQTVHFHQAVNETNQLSTNHETMHFHDFNWTPFNGPAGNFSGIEEIEHAGERDKIGGGGIWAQGDCFPQFFRHFSIPCSKFLKVGQFLIYRKIAFLSLGLHV